MDWWKPKNNGTESVDVQFKNNDKWIERNINKRILATIGCYFEVIILLFYSGTSDAIIISKIGGNKPKPLIRVYDMDLRFNLTFTLENHFDLTLNKVINEKSAVKKI